MPCPYRRITFGAHFAPLVYCKIELITRRRVDTTNSNAKQNRAKQYQNIKSFEFLNVFAASREKIA
jgi:hypothetical protein